MMELKDLGPAVNVAVGISILFGSGCAAAWWLMRRVDNRIKEEINHIDRLQSIENRVSSVETNMATREDLAEMATKKDLTEMEARMATKEDLAEMEAKMATMATKEDLAEMATKDDMTTLKTVLLEAFHNRKRNTRR